MAKARQPAIVAIILFIGTLVLVGATVAVVNLPSSGTHRPHRSLPAAPAAAGTRSPAGAGTPSASTPSTAAALAPHPSRPAPTKPKPAPGNPSITYTVKPGDTLTVIAAWFKQHGYQALYASNKDVIGADPNLIRPGQRIEVRQGRMTIESAGTTSSQGT